MRFHGGDEVLVGGYFLPPETLDVGSAHRLDLLTLTAADLDESVRLDDQVEDVPLTDLRLLTGLREHDGETLVLRERRCHQEEDQKQEGDVRRR